MKQISSVKEKALEWGLSERTVAAMCKEGKISGAFKQGHVWLIPEDSVKPEDNRITSGAYIKSKELLPLPVGISDYILASSNYYYIDKTLLLKDFIDERVMVSLFLRPRRFGKTLNMNMIKTFFEKSDEDTSVYFRDKKIWKQGQKYRDYQGKYPVIFLSFKDVKYDNWKDTLEKLSNLIGDEYSRHRELDDSKKINKYDKEVYRRIVERKSSVSELSDSLLLLTKLLHEHHHIAPIIIIDEYDTPIEQGYNCGYYDEVIRFMRNLFSGGLKDNSHLSFGFLTGILKIAKESIFSGLNNLTVNFLLDEKYSEYFGFTTQEVKEMCKYYKAEDKFTEICEWYDGYLFGKSEIFNPWSLISYFRNDFKAASYWEATGNNEIIREVLSKAGSEIYEDLHKIMEGNRITALIDLDVAYPSIRKNPSSVYSFLLMAGYLKPSIDKPLYSDGEYLELSLPNKEIAIVYRKEILAQLETLVPQSLTVAFKEALFTRDTYSLAKHIRRFLKESVSYYDTIGENFYYGLVLGLCTVVSDQYSISSNREAGYGRYDIQMMPRNKLMPGVLIELKHEKDVPGDRLDEMAKESISQINEKEYETELKKTGVKNIIRYGVAFSGKEVRIITE